MNELREQLAALAHDQWSSWMRYMFEQSVKGDDGSIKIPPSLVNRWKRQMKTPYAELSEKEKESDRTEADKALYIIRSNDTSKT